MDLSNIIVPEEAKPAKIVTCVVEGILEESDLRELALGELAPSVENLPAVVEEEDPANLKRIKEKHHSVARLIAQGLQQRMVASLTGYNEAYLSVLLNAPAMIELVEMYRIQNGAASQVITEKLKTVGLKAVEQLEEKVDAGDMSVDGLLGVAKLGLDRGGHGPSSTQHNVTENHIIDHAALQELNRQARQRSAGSIVRSSDIRQTIEVKPEPIPDADD